MTALTRIFSKTIPRYCLVFSVLIFLSACSCYKLGNPGLDHLPFSTLYVKPIINETFVPQAQALLSEQLIHTLQQSGIYITQCEGSADATLVVVMNRYKEVLSATRKKDTTLASSFEVTLEARCTLVNNITGEIYFTNRKVSAYIEGQATRSLQRVLYQDMPVLTQKLADKIRNLVTGAW